MIRTYCGNDFVEVRRNAFLYIETLQQKGVTIETIDVETYVNGIFADKAGGTSLFGGESAYVIDSPASDKVMYEDTITHLEVFKESPNTFVVIEGALLAPEKKKFQKHGELEEFKSGAKERFNVFALGDALSRKDKKSLWMLLHDAKREGLSEEEIIGTLWWQLKTLRLATITTSAAEAGMKDFPYNKAKRALTKFKEGELVALSESLMKTLHDSRQGVHDLDLALERWVLTM